MGLIHLDLHAVCVGTVREIAPGMRSAIDKHPVRDETIRVGPLGLDGDEQKERRLSFGRQLHGGPDKALLAYPHEHLAAWSETTARPSPTCCGAARRSLAGWLRR